MGGEDPKLPAVRSIAWLDGWVVLGRFNLRTDEPDNRPNGRKDDDIDQRIGEKSEQKEAILFGFVLADFMWRNKPSKDAQGRPEDRRPATNDKTGVKHVPDVATCGSDE